MPLPTTKQLITVTAVPFCRSGLEGRLLGLALQSQQPQLEAQRTALLQQEEEQRLQLASLDAQVLQSLATSKVQPNTSTADSATARFLPATAWKMHVTRSS